MRVVEIGDKVTVKLPDGTTFSGEVIGASEMARTWSIMVGEGKGDGAKPMYVIVQKPDLKVL